MNCKLTFALASVFAIAVLVVSSGQLSAQYSSDNIAGAASYFESSDCGCGSCMSLPGCDDGCCDGLGPYVSVFGGLATIHQLEEEIVTPNVIPGDPDTEFRSFSGDTGEAYGIAVGQIVHQRARTEIEYSYREFDLDTFRIEEFTAGVLSSSTTTPITGNVETSSLMGNFVFDLSPRCVGRANLYGGGGVGGMDINGTATDGATDYEIDDTAFAYQLIAGVNFAKNNRTDIFTEYRFTGSSVDVFDVTNGISLGNFDFETNTLVLGVRIRR
ncbi:MAG: outer membrane beta-barrel protein [Planctomycetota bacterium]